MLNSFQYCPTEMFRIKTNGLVKVPVLVVCCIYVCARNTKNSKIEL